MNKSSAFGALVLCVLIALAGCAPQQPPATPTPSPESKVPTPEAVAAAASPTPAPSPTPEKQGLTVVIDPGHGGEDLGARHFNRDGEMDLHESTVTLAISLKLGEKLEALGYNVAYTREDDSDPNMYERDLDGDGEITLRDVVQARTDLINESGADVMLSIHMNAWECDDEELLRATGGIETYYCSEREFADQNLLLANLVHENIIAAMKQFGYELPDRGVRIGHEPTYPGDPGGHLMVLGPVDDVIVRASQMPGILSEPMFITCDAEAELMQREDVQDALAQAYADAVVAFFEETGMQ